MCKVLLTLPIVGVLLIIGCENPQGPDVAPTVTYEAIQNGAGLRLAWTALSGVDGYYVYVNEGAAPECTTTAISVDVFGPAKVIEICGYTGDKDGPKWSSGTELEPAVSTITVYGASDPSPTNPSGFGFATDGSAITYPLSGADTLTNWPKIDLYLEDRVKAMNLFAPTDVPPAAFPYHDLNSEPNSSVEMSGIAHLDDADSAYTPGGTYSTQTVLAIGGVYSFWIDEGPTGWDKDYDHFGKLEVLSISGTKVDIKVAYQKKTGYRMLVTD